MDACRDYNYHYSVKSLKFIFFKKIENQNGSIATGPKPTSIIQKKKRKISKGFTKKGKWSERTIQREGFHLVCYLSLSLIPIFNFCPLPWGIVVFCYDAFSEKERESELPCRFGLNKRRIRVVVFLH